MAQQYTVREGDCIASVAFAFGFHPDAIWRHPDNDALRSERASGYVLLPGDVLVIPDKQPASYDRATGARHTFRRRAVPEKLKLQLKDGATPRAAVRYTLTVDDRARTGETDAEGRIDEWIPPDAHRGVLALEDGQTIELQLGRLWPADSRRGQLERLRNLGFLGVDTAGASVADADLIAALRRFQGAHRLPLTGVADEATRAQLVAAHRG